MIGPRGTSGPHVLVSVGPDALRSLGGRLDQLQARTDAPVMARRTWLQVWLDTHRDWQPLVIAVECPDGTLGAAALLATRRRLGVTTVVVMGHQASDTVITSALDDATAERLTDAVSAHLETLRPWNLMLRNVHPDDPLLRRLGDRVRRPLLLDGDVSPVLRTDGASTLDDHVSGSHRRGVNRLRNRIRRAGITIDVDHLSGPEELSAVLPEVEHVHRLRDDDLGRTSGMDKPAERTFFHRLVAALAAADEVCLTTLRLDGVLAAYSLCFVDGTDHRMWNTRFDPDLGQYSPGKVVLDESIRHALEQGATSFDFMRGDEPYKDSYANDRVRAIELLAGSNLAVAAAHRVYLCGRDRLRRMDEQGDCSGRFADRLRDVRRRLRR